MATTANNITTVISTEKNPEMPIREWSGGEKLNGKTREAGYLLIAPDGTCEAYVHRFAYDQYRPFMGSAFLRRRLVSTRPIGTYADADEGRQAVVEEDYAINHDVVVYR